MKLTACLRLFVAIAALQLSSTRGADTHCDCTIVPFEPNPPCASVCIAKYMAIASADDLRNIFGLPNDVAKTIANIAPNNRPHSLEDYKRLIPGPAYQALEQRIHSLRAEDFKSVARNAAIRGMSLDKLQW
jgi:hypothetical protein